MKSLFLLGVVLVLVGCAGVGQQTSPFAHLNLPAPDQPPVLVKRVEPVYRLPTRPVGHGLEQGEVKVTFIVEEDGTVKEMVVESPFVALEDLAREAVRQWRYEPATLGGQPVRSVASVWLMIAPKGGYLKNLPRTYFPRGGQTPGSALGFP